MLPWIILALVLFHFLRPPKKQVQPEESEDFEQAKAAAGPPKTIEDAMDLIATELAAGDSSA